MAATVLGHAYAARLDVVGQRHDASGVITHVGLLAEPADLCVGDTAHVHHMGPPLVVDPPGQFPVTVHGSLPLTRDEQEGIDEWLAEIAPWTRRCTYVALPAVRERRDEISQQIIGWDFSCAGFVAAAYERGADITLVDQTALPSLDAATTQSIWGSSITSQRFLRFAPRFGLTGDGPWPLLVPGYILHAFARDRSELPHRPVATDIAFP